MRIISGKFKGRIITSPNSKYIRPMTDRVRVNLFDILTNKIDFNGTRVLDLYSGSGSIGLECLSRGADEVHFIERNFIIYKNLVKNIESLDVKAQCKIFKMEALKFSRMEDHGLSLAMCRPDAQASQSLSSTADDAGAATGYAWVAP